MFSFIKRIWSRILGFRYHRARHKIPGILSGPHDCALVALAQVLPDLDKEKIKVAFSNCCDLWPYAGVTNKEFNITLRYLGILERFEYDDRDGLIIKNFRHRKGDIFIVLIYGHFQVLDNKNKAGCYYPANEKSTVYCSWRLLPPSSTNVGRKSL